MGSKLGIIFAFLLSVAAAGGSYYLYQGWVEERTVRGSVEAKYDQVKEKMITVQSEKEDLKAKSEEYRTKAEAMQAQLEKLQIQQSRIDSEKAALEHQLKSHQGMIAELQKQVAELAKKAKDAQAACGVTPADLKTDVFSSPKAFEGTATSTLPASSVTGSEADSSQLVFKPMTSGGTAAPEAFTDGATTAEAPVVREESVIAAPAEPATPRVAPVEAEKSAEVSAASAATTNAKVLTVNRKFNFVVINQGLQDGLKMGDRLKVLKQGQESATIQVEKLYDKFSAATLVEEDPKQQVVEGDAIRKV